MCGRLFLSFAFIFLYFDYMQEIRGKEMDGKPHKSEIKQSLKTFKCGVFVYAVFNVHVNSKAIEMV